MMCTPCVNLTNKKESSLLQYSDLVKRMVVHCRKAKGNHRGPSFWNKIELKNNVDLSLCGLAQHCHKLMYFRFTLRAKQTKGHHF